MDFAVLSGFHTEFRWIPATVQAAARVIGPPVIIRFRAGPVPRGRAGTGTGTGEQGESGA